MANKDTYISNLLGLSYVVSVKDPVLVENWGNINVYDIAYLENNSNKMAEWFKHRFIVIAEGQAGETAVPYSRKFYPKFTSNDTFISAAKSYLDSKVTDGTFEGYIILKWDYEQKWVKAKAIEIIDSTTCQEIDIFVYNDGGATHRKIV